MKTLLKVNKLELVKNYQNIVLLKASKVISKFALDQLLPAIIGYFMIYMVNYTKKRFYRLNLNQDLFGNLCVVKMYGGLGKKATGPFPFEMQ